MTVDSVSGAVTIRRGRESFCCANETGVTVRNAPWGRARRFAWSEISGFTDGLVEPESGKVWALHIVLRKGRTVPVHCTRSPSANPDVLAAIRQLAERHGIPADLTGVLMEHGLPPREGLYEDPGGQVGVRYWDGTQWSPLLPAAASKWGAVGKSTARWTTLSVAPEPWSYPATRASRQKIWVGVLAVPTAAIVIAGLVAGIWWRWYDAAVWFFAAAFPGLALLVAWANWHHWRSFRNWLTSSDGRLN